MSQTNSLSMQAFPQTATRPHVQGKFLFVGDEKFFVRGVTYGPFRPEPDGSEYHTAEIVAQDFASMAQHGINAVRTYTVPPRWLLDCAQDYGLRVMVGLPWEQHIAFLDDPERPSAIEHRVQSAVGTCAGHNAILCYTIGNEIPAPIVRWHGRKRVEHFLKRLHHAVQAADPGALITYVNYPTTEYLDLPFVDVVSFNVYLEAQDRLEAYLARLQNLAGDKPLILAEIGLDSRRNGEEGQANSLNWQVQTAFAAGCAGACVFAWTDEWHRGGHDIEDWDFGLTDRNRQPKPALCAVERAYAEAPLPARATWPRVSVIVCSYNGSQTIRECCEGLQALDYPDYEVIVVDDGSTDNVGAIAQSFGFRVIRTTNQGLSNARNTGLQAASGEIVAYIDDDAWPDSHWLTYLVATFMDSDHVGVGGPNLPPPGGARIAAAVANAPGGPTHVLLSDSIAEHIPGCNMAFRREALLAVAGFDPQFRIAGDDVDLCWRLQERSWTLGYSPAAQVWHHRRTSVTAYLRQQLNYGKAEALLEMKWPEKYNSLGHISWQGRLYGLGLARTIGLHRPRIYHGVWGSGLFQSIYEPAPGMLASLPLMPEWYMLTAGIAVLAALGLLWQPLLLALPLLLLALAVSVVQAMVNASRARFPAKNQSRTGRLAMFGLTTVLYGLQPLARLLGRLRYGLTPWRRRNAPTFDFPRPRTATVWSEHWQAPEARLTDLEADLRRQGAVVSRGGDFDLWDLEVRGGLFGSIRLRTMLEEHGAGRQLLRLHSWPRLSATGVLPVALLVVLALAASMDLAWTAAILLGTMALLLAARVFGDCAAATASLAVTLRETHGSGLNQRLTAVLQNSHDRTDEAN